MEPPLSPSWLQIEQTIGQRPQFTGDALSMRQQYKAFSDQANSSCTKSANLSIEDIKISPHLTARVYRPGKSEGIQLLPIGVYFHGGGWCCGDLDTEDPFCQLVAEHLPCAVVSVDYRLAPEYKSPTQIEDALDRDHVHTILLEKPAKLSAHLWPVIDNNLLRNTMPADNIFPNKHRQILSRCRLNLSGLQPTTCRIARLH
ncbi:Alpha/Beta hydrolase protein [Aspergillus navahoensis]